MTHHPLRSGRGAGALALTALLVCLPPHARAQGVHAQAGPLAVLVTGTCRSCGPHGGDGYNVVLSDATGQPIAQAAASTPPSQRVGSGPAGSAPALSLPPVNVSGSHVYLLDSGGRLRSLGRDGSRAVAGALRPAEPHVSVGFAVSPDALRIAVGVLTYTGCRQTAGAEFCAGARTWLYVEDLHGGGHHVDLFTSDTTFEWPVGWHAGALAVAVSHLPGNQYPAPNPYAAYNGYHLVSATTGLRIASLCADSTNKGTIDALGSLNPMGTLCVRQTPRGRALYLDTWTGQPRLLNPALPSFAAALTPDGRYLAATASDGRIVVQDQTSHLRRLTITGAPLGWLDDDHLIVQSGLDSATYGIADLHAQRASTLPWLPRGSQLSYLGILPGAR